MPRKDFGYGKGAGGVSGRYEAHLAAQGLIQARDPARVKAIAKLRRLACRGIEYRGKLGRGVPRIFTLGQEGVLLGGDSVLGLQPYADLSADFLSRLVRFCERWRG